MFDTLQRAVFTRIRIEYTNLGYLTDDMKRDLRSVDINPTTFATEVSLFNSNQGALSRNGY